MGLICGHGMAASFAKLVITSALLALWASAADAASIDPDDAARHVGETATVCGVVASATYAAHSRAQPTFLNLGRPYSNQIFTAVIFGSDRAKFGEPQATLRGRRICVTSVIRLYRGKPEVILHDPSELTQQ